ncbi:MAG: hypothetical protein ACYC66_02460, partial [Chloroflexota bacterium]
HRSSDDHTFLLSSLREVCQGFRGIGEGFHHGVSGQRGGDWGLCGQRRTGRYQRRGRRSSSARDWQRRRPCCSGYLRQLGFWGKRRAELVGGLGVRRREAAASQEGCRGHYGYNSQVHQ